MLKRKLAILMSGLLVVACSTQNLNVENKGFSTKALENKPNPSPSKALSDSDIEDLSKAKPPENAPVFSKDVFVKDEYQDNENEIKFENPKSDSFTKDTTSIVVIYHNDHKIRVNKKNKKVSSISSESEQINSILEKYQVKDISTLGDITTEDESKKDEERSKNFYKKSVIPNRNSIHFYEFSKGTDYKSLFKELRQLVSVRSVDTVGSIGFDSTVTLLSRKKPNDVGNYPSHSNLAPSDPLFTTGTEATNWWYFKRHRIFESWRLYGNTTKPLIAVIDQGFYNNTDNNVPPTVEYPNYSGGYSIKLNTSGQTYETPGDIGTNIEPNSNLVISHGATVSGTISNPKDNGIGLSGVLPNTSILPININVTSTSEIDKMKLIARAVYLAGDNTSVDVINISLNAVSNNVRLPVISNNIVKSEISTAVSKGKIVVITAGNNKMSLEPYITSSSSMNGVIVVGGSENDTSTNRSVGWKKNTLGYDLPDTGSNYGSLVDMTAAARFLAYDISSSDKYSTQIGTSIAAPIISVAAGMVKKFAGSTILTPDQIKSILIGTANLGRYNDGYPDSSTVKSTRYLGKNLNQQAINVNLQSNIRDLNLFNALIVAKNIGSYNAITRVFNIDDNIQATDSGMWGNWYAYEPYGNDTIYGINNLGTSSLNFRTYNSSGGYAYGYQVYKNKILNKEEFDGISGVIGAQNNATPVAGWYATKSF